MRILIEAVSFCEYIIQKANALVSRGHEVMLFMPHNLINSTVGDDISKVINPKIRTLFYKGKRRPNRLFYIFRNNLFKTIRDFNPDIIHVHINGEIETLLICLRFCKIPLIVTIHDVTPHVGEDSKISLRGKIICKYLRYHAAKIHVHGETLRNELISIYPAYKKKGVVIPHGTLSLFTHWDTGNIEREPQTCLFFGRMEKYRGLDNLVQIGSILKKMIPDIKIIVAGSGTELCKYKESLMALGIFEIHDAFIPDRAVYTFFRRASLLLLPYHEASQSGIVHMGLAFGVTIVATSVGAIPETILDGVHGRVVPPDNMKGFADAVVSLLQDRETLGQMEKACYEKGKQLEFGNIIEKYEDMYHEIVKNQK